MGGQGRALEDGVTQGHLEITFPATPLCVGDTGSRQRRHQNKETAMLGITWGWHHPVDNRTPGQQHEVGHFETGRPQDSLLSSSVWV